MSPLGGVVLIVAAELQAARVAVALSTTGSGAGPQIYAEKTGVGSVLSPREIMIPNGSVKPISLRSFFILALTLGSPFRGAGVSKALGVPCWTSHASDC